jgi:hypothetical protein
MDADSRKKVWIRRPHYRRRRTTGREASNKNSPRLDRFEPSETTNDTKDEQNHSNLDQARQAVEKIIGSPAIKQRGAWTFAKHDAPEL